MGSLLGMKFLRKKSNPILPNFKKISRTTGKSFSGGKQKKDPSQSSFSREKLE